MWMFLLLHLWKWNTVLYVGSGLYIFKVGLGVLMYTVTVCIPSLQIYSLSG